MPAENALTPPGDDRPTRNDGQSARETRRRKFPYRKPSEIEAEIGTLEAESSSIEAALAQPETWRNPETARSTQARYDELKGRLEYLYAHWEEALELNS